MTRGIAAALLLLVATWPVSADKATWDVNGQTYSLYRANFHIHTEWSREKAIVDAAKGLFDHWLSVVPRTTLEAGAQAGLDVVGFSDHCFQIDPWEWGVLPWGKKPKHYPDATILGTTGQWDIGGRNRVVIAGYEWTPDDDTGHINVFYPGLDRGDLFSSEHELKAAERAKKCPVIYAREEEFGSQQFVREFMGSDLFSRKAKELPDFYRELANVYGNPGLPDDEKPFAQFNHPSQYSGQFDGFALNESAQEAFCLFEVATCCTLLHVHFDKAIGTTFTNNEPLYRLALQREWRVAPSVGLDNVDAGLDLTRSSYTGVWATGVSGREIGAAVRARRVFATEVPGLALKFDASIGHRVIQMGAQEEIVAQDTPTFCVELGWEDGATPAALSGRPSLWTITSSGSSATAMEPLSNARDERRFAVAKQIPTGFICAYVSGQFKGDKHFASAPIWLKRPDAEDTVPPLTAPASSLVLDVSGSMRWGGKLEAAGKAAEAFLNANPPEAKISLVTFASRAEVIHPLGAVKDTRPEVIASIRTLEAQDATNIGDGLSRGLGQVASAPRDASSVVIMSDGCNNTGHSDDQVVEMARRGGVKVHTVAFGNDADIALMRRIAQASGGNPVMPADVGTLVSVYQKMAMASQGLSIAGDFADRLGPGQAVTYKLEVPEGLERLKTYVDWSSPGLWGRADAVQFDVRLRDPQGKAARPEMSRRGSWISLAVPYPSAGTWRLTVKAKSVPDEGHVVRSALGYAVPGIQIVPGMVMPQYAEGGTKDAGGPPPVTVAIRSLSGQRISNVQMQALIVGPSFVPNAGDKPLGAMSLNASQSFKDSGDVEYWEVGVPIFQAGATGGNVLSLFVSWQDGNGDQRGLPILQALQVGHPRHNKLTSAYLQTKLQDHLRSSLWRFLETGKLDLGKLDMGRLGEDIIPRELRERLWPNLSKHVQSK